MGNLKAGEDPAVSRTQSEEGGRRFASANPRTKH